jgi:hypothetical protein
LFKEPIIWQCSKALEPIGSRLIDGLAIGESPCTWEYIVWVEICLLAWRYFGNNSLELHDVYVD